MGRPVTDRLCPNVECAMSGKTGKGNIVLHGLLKLKRGRHRRYRYRTPAMQAGLVARRPTFPDVFTGVAAFLSSVAPLIAVRWPCQGLVLGLAAA